MLWASEGDAAALSLQQPWRSIDVKHSVLIGLPSLLSPPPSSQITVYIRASILSVARTHVPDIKLLMKYLPGLQGLLQPAQKPPLSP